MRENNLIEISEDDLRLVELASFEMDAYRRMLSVLKRMRLTPGKEEVVDSMGKFYFEKYKESVCDFESKKNFVLKKYFTKEEFDTAKNAYFDFKERKVELSFD